jgi:antitoxin component HigA of HigAB toxin-antitoxin module
MANDRKDRKALVAALAETLKTIDAEYKEEFRELRELFEEAKKEAEKKEPDRVKLKALLADANEMARTFATLDPAWQAVQRVAKMFGLL